MRKRLVVLLFGLLLAVPVLAFLPVAPFAGMALSGGSAGTVAVGGGGSLLGLIGAGVGWLALAFAPSDAGGGGDMRVPLTNDPAKQPQAPSAPASAPWVTHVTLCWKIDGNDACLGDSWSGPQNTITDGMPASQACSIAGGSPGAAATTCNGISCNVAGQGWKNVCRSVGGPNTEVCRTGYVWNAAHTQCVLSNPRAVTPDGKCDFGRASGGGFVSVSDVDCGAGGIPAGAVQPDGSILVSGKDANGNPLYVNVTPLGDGGARVDRVTQTPDSVGNSTLTHQQLQVSPGGQIVNAGQYQQPGTLTPNAPNTGYEPTPSPSPTPVNNVQIPTDYARQGEAEAAQVQTRVRLDKINDTLAASAPIAEVPQFAGDFDDDGVWFGDTFDDLMTWTLPSHYSECPAFAVEFDMGGRHFASASSAHCDLMSSHADTLSSIMLVCWTLCGMFIVLRA